MVETILFIILGIWVIGMVGYVFNPYPTYTTKGSPRTLPDLRIAHYSKSTQSHLLVKAEEKRSLQRGLERERMEQEMRELEKRIWMEETERVRQIMIENRLRAWKNGTP